MISLVEALAMVSLIGSAVLVLRRRWRRGSAMALMLAGLCAALAMATPASATEWRKGQTVEVAQGETIRGNVFMMGAQVRVEGTVDGDVYAWGQDITIRGHVTGDVIGGGQTIRIEGQVDGNVRTWSNSLVISGSVGRDVLCGDQTFNLDTPGKIGRSLTTFSQTIELDGRLGRDLMSFAQTVSISGTVDGSIEARGRTLNINSGAVINGKTTFVGDQEPSVSSSAKLATPVNYTKHTEKRAEFGKSTIFWQVILMAAFVLYGLVLMNLMPQFARESVRSAESIGASLGLGILVFFGVLIGAVIVCVTVVGLFVGLSTFFAWVIAVYAAQTVVGALVGQWLMGRTQEMWPMIGRMTVGVIIIRAITMLPHGGWVKFGVVLWGLGAISIALYRRFQPPVRAGAAPVGPGSPLPAATTVGAPV